MLVHISYKAIIQFQNSQSLASSYICVYQLLDSGIINNAMIRLESIIYAPKFANYAF